LLMLLYYTGVILDVASYLGVPPRDMVLANLVYWGY
jgi:hypothetical protein